MPNLTLAICVYNAEKYIKETLESVMAQTMQDFHLLIVNDCSTDGSVAVVEEFFAQHPRQHEIVTLEKNGGIAKARNFAIAHADTEYFLFIDSDDLLESTLVEKEYSTITQDKEYYNRLKRNPNLIQGCNNKLCFFLKDLLNNKNT